jgi:hypothetical protein
MFIRFFWFLTIFCFSTYALAHESCDTFDRGIKLESSNIEDQSCCENPSSKPPRSPGTENQSCNCLKLFLPELNFELSSFFSNEQLHLIFFDLKMKAFSRRIDRPPITVS